MPNEKGTQLLNVCKVSKKYTKLNRLLAVHSFIIQSVFLGRLTDVFGILNRLNCAMRSSAILCP